MTIWFYIKLSLNRKGREFLYKNRFRDREVMFKCEKVNVKLYENLTMIKINKILEYTSYYMYENIR